MIGVFVCLLAAAAAAEPKQALDDAMQLYMDAQPAEARRRLQELLGSSADLPAGVRQDALAYLGDILLSEGDKPAARAVFEALLDEAPAYLMDPFAHPPDVCAYFEDLRLARRSEVVILPPIPPPVPTRGPFPIWSFAPGGVYYFVKGRPAAGVAWAGLQVTALATNITLFLYHTTSIPPSRESDTQAAAEWAAWQTATNVAGGVAIATMVLPPLIETSAWLSRPSARVVVTPNGVVLNGTF